MIKNTSGELYFALADEGLGIFRAKQQSIFNRYGQGDEDKEQLKTMLSTLRQFKIYQSTEIENTLARLNAQEGSGLSVFCQKLVNASYNGDEERFRKLLDEIDG